MSKRILLPVLITTSIIGLGAGTLIVTPLISHAQDNEKNRYSDRSYSGMMGDMMNGGGIMGYFGGKRARSNDLAYAKSLGVDTTKLEDAQNKVKDAEKNLKNEFSSLRDAVRDAVIKKAQDQNVDPKIIEDYKTAYQNLADEQKSLTDAIADPNAKVQDVKELRQKVKDARDTLRESEKVLKNAIK